MVAMKNTRPHRHPAPAPESRRDSGNVLFLVLIAVVLFAALSFAVTMSNRGGGEDSTRELAQIAASRLAQHSTDLERAVVRMRVSLNIAADVISFENAAVADYVNPGCTIDRCRVFTTAGGQATYITPEEKWLDIAQAGQDYYREWLFTGSACIPGVGLGDNPDCTGDTANFELLAIVPYISRATCVQVNKKLDLGSEAAPPPQVVGAVWSATPQFTGAYGGGGSLIDAGGVLFGALEGCFEGNGTPAAGTYHYFRVLFPR